MAEIRVAEWRGRCRELHSLHHIPALRFLIRGDAGYWRGFGVAQRLRRQLHSLAQTRLSGRDGKVREAAMTIGELRYSETIGRYYGSLLA